MEYGLIGEKLSYSYSKRIHELIGNYSYELKEIKKGDFKDFILKKDYKAINITIPYKEEVCKYVNYFDESSKDIKCVNLLINDDSKLIGYNTDYYGLLANIKRNNIDLNNKKVLILGTGGTSKTAFKIAKELNAKQIVFVSRYKKDYAITYDVALKEYNDFEIIINTTPVGMMDFDDGLPIDISKFNYLEAVIDVIYNPINTSLILEAKKRNIKVAGGLYMLVYQAYYAYCLLSNNNIDENKIENIYKLIKKENQNIVLIGMPCSGKSTISKKISDILKINYIDSDEEIEKNINMTIKEFINRFGEIEFRKIEEDLIKSISKKRGYIISTGGGVILNENNINRLKGNGIIIFIDRDVSKLEISEERPLSNTKEKLYELYKKRKEKYENYSDYIIKNNDNLDETINEVLEVIRNENINN